MPNVSLPCCRLVQSKAEIHNFYLYGIFSSALLCHKDADQCVIITGPVVISDDSRSIKINHNSLPQLLPPVRLCTRTCVRRCRTRSATRWMTRSARWTTRSSARQSRTDGAVWASARPAVPTRRRNVTRWDQGTVQVSRKATETTNIREEFSELTDWLQVVDTINEQTCSSRSERKCVTVNHPACHVMKVRSEE